MDFNSLYTIWRNNAESAYWLSITFFFFCFLFKLKQIAARTQRCLHEPVCVVAFVPMKICLEWNGMDWDESGPSDSSLFYIWASVRRVENKLTQNLWWNTTYVYQAASNIDTSHNAIMVEHTRLIRCKWTTGNTNTYGINNFSTFTHQCNIQKEMQILENAY